MLFHYLRQCLRVVGFLERSLPGRQLKGEHSHRPDIHLLVVVLTSQHFWGKVVEGPAEGASPGLRDHCPAEVSDLKRIARNQDVLRLDVPVDDVARVEVGKPLTNLLQDHGNLTFQKGTNPSHYLVELPFGSVLED